MFKFVPDTTTYLITSMHYLLFFDIVYPDEHYFSNLKKTERIRNLLTKSPGYLEVTAQQKTELELAQQNDFGSTYTPLSAEQQKELNDGCGCG